MRVWLAVVLLIIPITLKDTKTKKKEPDLNFKWKKVKGFIKRNTFVLAVWNRKTDLFGKRIQDLLIKLSSDFYDDDIRFIQIPVKKDSKKLYKTELYIEGVPRVYKGDYKEEMMRQWIHEILHILPQHKSFINELESIDRHYFVTVSEKYKKSNEKRINHLAKLIHPISLIYGLSKDELAKLGITDGNGHDLSAYREYQDKVITIDPQKSLAEIVKQIELNEFPDYIYPTEPGLRLITQLKLPALIYFTNKRNDPFSEVMKELAKPYQRILLLTIVNVKNKNKESTFLKNFMQVKKTPAIRILNMTKELKRFKYIGKPNSKIINNFLNNYLYDNLESYNISEKIANGKKIGKIPKINYRAFQSMVLDGLSYNLVYVYGGRKGLTDPVIAVLEEVQSALSFQSNFNISLIDHHRNDINGYYNDDLPFLILIKKNREIIHYEGSINTSDVIDFVLKTCPSIEISMSAAGDDL